MQAQIQMNSLPHHSCLNSLDYRKSFNRVYLVTASGLFAFWNVPGHFFFFREAQLPHPDKWLQQQLHTPKCWTPANFVLISGTCCSDVPSVPWPKHPFTAYWVICLVGKIVLFLPLTSCYPKLIALLIASDTELPHCVEWPYFCRQDVYDKGWKVVPVHWGSFPVKRWFCCAIHCYFRFKG